MAQMRRIERQVMKMQMVMAVMNVVRETMTLPRFVSVHKSDMLMFMAVRLCDVISSPARMLIAM